MQTRLTAWCNGILEAGWLIALLLIPLFFNIHSERVFEPDKIALLRSITLLMLVVWIVRWIDQRGWEQWHPRHPAAPWHPAAWKRHPLLVTVVLLVALYLFTTLFSLAPRISLLGSWQRLQGTYTTLSYIAIFGMVITTLRTRAQWERIVTVLIITSIPVSFYAMLQKFQLDPLPWGGNTSVRVAGHLGNAIFIAAWLIMVMPLTAVRIVESFRAILRDQALPWSEPLRASAYLFLLLIQFLAIYWTQSRGPLLGLGVGLFAFGLILLVALRNRAGQGGSERGSALAGPLLFAGLLVLALGAGTVIVSAENPRPFLSFALFGGVAVGLAAALFVLAASGRGWRWLWAAWLTLLFTLGAILLLYNVAARYPAQIAGVPVIGRFSPLFATWQELPTVGRLGAMLNAEAGTSRVRLLIWQGSLELIAPHEPLATPLGQSDRFNLLRPLIGYGPETMYIAYNRFYPPELATVEARNASPDRAHNETFDALVITGIVGFLVWQALYLALFHVGFRYLGIIRTRRDSWRLVLFWVAGAAVGTVILVAYGGLELVGIAVPFGSMAGLVGCLVYDAVFGRNRNRDNPPPHTLLMIGLLAAIIAHYIEIHFGIAIVSTRLTFFVMAALVWLLARRAQSGAEDEEIAYSQREIGRNRLLMAGGILLVLMLGTAGYTFTNFAPMPGETEALQAGGALPTPLETLNRSFLRNARQDFAPSPWLYAMLVMSHVLAAFLWLVESVPPAAQDRAPRTPSRKAGRSVARPAAAWLPALVLGGAGAIGLVPRFTDGSPLAVAAGALWFLIAAGSAGAWQMYSHRPNVVRLPAGAATLGLLCGLPLVTTGSATLIGVALVAAGALVLWLLWQERGQRAALQPALSLALLGSGAWVAGLFWMILHADRTRQALIVMAGAAGAPPWMIEADRAVGLIAGYWIFWIVALIALGTVWGWSGGAAPARKGAGRPALVALALLGLLALLLVQRTNLRIVQADMVFKRGRPYDQAAGQLLSQLASLPPESDQARAVRAAAIGRFDAAATLYERAIGMDPAEDYYYLWLGRLSLERVRPAPEQAGELLRSAENTLLTAQRLNPYNTDHTANLARLNARWAALADGGEQEQRAALSADYYVAALALSPNNAVVRNEYARLLYDYGDCDRAVETIRQSAVIDPFYEQTYFLSAEILDQCARRTSPPNLALYDEALQRLDRAFDHVPPRRLERMIPDIAVTRYRLALRLADLGESARAAAAARAALPDASPDLAPQIEQFLTTLTE
jgi:tetratricopeptide (TPR) repeat protein